MLTNRTIYNNRIGIRKQNIEYLDSLKTKYKNKSRVGILDYIIEEFKKNHQKYDEDNKTISN